MKSKSQISTLIILVIAVVGFFVVSQNSISNPQGPENEVIQVKKPIPAVASSTTIKTVVSAASSSTIDVNTNKKIVLSDNDVSTSTFDVFSRNPEYLKSDYPVYSSNVVGYFAHGAFILDWPNWLVENWHTIKSQNSDDMIFTPNVDILNRDFSDIAIVVQKSTENYNADTLYGNDLNNKSGLLISEVILNKAEDLRVYHIERSLGNGNISETMRGKILQYNIVIICCPEGFFICPHDSIPIDNRGDIIPLFFDILRYTIRGYRILNRA